MASLCVSTFMQHTHLLAQQHNLLRHLYVRAEGGRAGKGNIEGQEYSPLGNGVRMGHRGVGRGQEGTTTCTGRVYMIGYLGTRDTLGVQGIGYKAGCDAEVMACFGVGGREACFAPYQL